MSQQIPTKDIPVLLVGAGLAMAPFFVLDVPSLYVRVGATSFGTALLCYLFAVGAFVGLVADLVNSFVLRPSGSAAVSPLLSAKAQRIILVVVQVASLSACYFLLR